MSTPPVDPAFARKVVIAALIESAWVILVLGAYLTTENLWLLVGGMVLGAIPLSLYVVRLAAASGQTKAPSIVEGGRR
jgi:hypothetical protein